MSGKPGPHLWARLDSSHLGLAELRRRTPEGICPFCGEACPQRSTKPTAVTARHKRMRALGKVATDFYITCNDEVCLAAYNRYYRRDQRRAKYALTDSQFAGGEVSP